MAVETPNSRQGEPSRSAGGHNQVVRKRSNAGRQQDEKMIGQWRIGRTIGKGSSGRVKIAKHAVTGKYAAIKIVPKGAIISSRLSVSEAGARADKVLLGIEREIVIMKLIDHPNVLNLYDVWETSSELYLIMEYVPGGELFDYLVKRGRLPVSEALHYFQQIIYAVDYCHRFNICHRDLKPENLLLDKDKNIKVADFGMAAWEAGERMLETSCGSPHYASPEIVAGKAYHGSSSDIWSCGIILFALLTGRLPFDDDNIRSLLQKVKVGVFEMPDEIKDPARDLLSKMLEKDPERRISMPEILKHPFFISRAPRPIPGRALVSPPTLDEVDSPVSSPSEIDPDIMGNLKTLWSGASEDEIIEALMSREKTWEKAIYHLLVKYRNKHLENYNMDEEDEGSKKMVKKALTASSASPPKRKGTAPAPTTSTPQKKVLGENTTIQPTASPIARPQAPTPKKASAAIIPDSPASRPQSKLSPRPPQGPRPPNNRNSSYVSDDSSAPNTPAIILQEATPTKEMLPPRTVSRPVSTIIPGPTDKNASRVPSINIPQVENEQLQQFINDVAAQLNTINIRSSVASGSSGSSAILGTDYQAYLSYLSNATAGGHNSIMPPPSARPISTISAVSGAYNYNGPEAIKEEVIDDSSDCNQFADADDDQTEAASVHSISIAPPPLIGLGIGGYPQRPALHPTASSSTNPNRWSYASSSSNASPIPGIDSPMLQTPAMMWANPNADPTPHTQIMHAQRSAPVPPAVRNATRPAPTPPVRATSVSSSRRPATSPVMNQQNGSGELQRDGSYLIINNVNTPSVENSSWSSRHTSYSNRSGGQDAFGMLKKKNKKQVTIELPKPFSPNFSSTSSGAPSPSFYSSGSSSAAPSPLGTSHLKPGSSTGDQSPKRSWFGNLFSFKPAPATLICKDSISDTRDKSKKVMFELGVKTSVVEFDGVRGLKCRYDDVKDSSGNVTIKGVRFRAEFSRATSSSSNGSFPTLVSLTLEKGAQSSFRNIYHSLKSSLEDPLSPSTSTTSNSRHGHPASILQSGPGSISSRSAPNTPVIAAPKFGVSPQMPMSARIPGTVRF